MRVPAAALAPAFIRPRLRPSQRTRPDSPLAPKTRHGSDVGPLRRAYAPRNQVQVSRSCREHLDYREWRMLCHQMSSAQPPVDPVAECSLVLDRQRLCGVVHRFCRGRAQRDGIDHPTATGTIGNDNTPSRPATGNSNAPEKHAPSYAPLIACLASATPGTNAFSPGCGKRNASVVDARSAPSRP